MWFSWAQANQLNVERMEDIILVSGCTLVTSWAAAAFADNTLNAEISLASTTFGNVGAIFTWNNVRGPVSYHNSRFDPVSSPNQVYWTCPNSPFVVAWKAKSTHDASGGSVRLYQGLPR